MPRAMPNRHFSQLLYLEKKNCDMIVPQPEVNVKRTHWGVVGCGSASTYRSPSDFVLGLKRLQYQRLIAPLLFLVQ